jgi:AbrB family looped-hinge helix DNA binding protein
MEHAMFDEVRARISQNGRVVIPAAFRKALGVDDVDELVLRLQDGEVLITTLQRRIRRAQERARRYLKPGTSPVDELLKERREAANRE